jgi:hypothetical protein
MARSVDGGCLVVSPEVSDWRWTNRRFGTTLGREQVMVGPIITFLGVCALVAGFMWIAHRFLREAEEPEDAARAERIRRMSKPSQPPPGDSRQPQWAH